MSVEWNNKSLHWVLKIGNLKTSMQFFEQVLQMKVLRHEEFTSGCEATCNGPYGGAWSKTMIGYGPEDSNFVLELTYNYGINSYKKGNDLQYIALHAPSSMSLEDVYENARSLGYVVDVTSSIITGPDNYHYKILPSLPSSSDSEEKFVAIGLRVNSLEGSIRYWKGLLQLQEYAVPEELQTGSSYPSIFLSYNKSQVGLQLIEVQDGSEVDHALSSGRIAFACQSVYPIYETILTAITTTTEGVGERGQGTGSSSGVAVGRIQTPPLTLPTPGKADVVVIILVDPNGYEICFVEDIAFYELAIPTYDSINFSERASRGGDGAPPPHKPVQTTSTTMTTSTDVTSESTSSSLVHAVRSLREFRRILREVREGKKKRFVLVDYHAAWCKNCIKITPLIHRLAQQYSSQLVVLSVDISDSGEEVEAEGSSTGSTGSGGGEEIALEYNVTAIPRLMLFSEEIQIGDYLGSSEKDIEAFLSNHISLTSTTTEKEGSPIDTPSSTSSSSSSTTTTIPHVPRILLPSDVTSHRSLHWVLKIGNLKTSMQFFEQVLQMKVLRHEEFTSGCEATCNGPYGGAWSKTMIGYGPEDSNFVLELTYNYGINSYKKGNDLQYIALHAPNSMSLEELYCNARSLGYVVDVTSSIITGPDHYHYKILPSLPSSSDSEEKFVAIGLRVNSLEVSVRYWKGLLQLQEYAVPVELQTGSSSHPSIFLSYNKSQVGLQLIEVQDGCEVDHALSSGRIAFACQSVYPIYETILTAITAATEGEGGDGDGGGQGTGSSSAVAVGRIQTPPLTIPTPGKADVVVIILVDPNGYEICFVEDIAFYELAIPTYDSINFSERASRGGDGAPPPRKPVQTTSTTMTTSTDVTSESLSSSSLVRAVRSLREFRRILREEREGTKKRFVLVDYHAAWCKNCIKISPLIHRLAQQYSSQLVVLSVDISDSGEEVEVESVTGEGSSGTGSGGGEEIALEYNVTAIPRLMLFSGEIPIGDYLGSSEKDIETFLSNHITLI